MLPPQTETCKRQSSALPLKTRSSPKSTLVLDMDGTLIHTTSGKLKSYDLRLDPEGDHNLAQVYVKFRPHVKEFIEEMSKYYEIVIFTAAEVIIN